MTKKIKFFVYFVGIFFVIFLVGCTQEATTHIEDQAVVETPEEEQMENSMEEIEEAGAMMEYTVDEPIESEETNLDWKEITLKDVSTQKEFKISDFKGKPILLESFAVWCPKCKKQQDEIKELHEEVGEDVISIALNTDPNEDEAKVLEHINRHGYTWIYAISPEKVTRSLIDQFGIQVVNAPQTPVILICEDQSARLLERGVKDVGELKSEIGAC